METVESAAAPIACTLGASALGDRLTAWSAVLDRAGPRTVTPTGALRIELAGVDVAALTELVVAEQQCCAFFSFAVTVDRRGVGLEVAAPDDAAGVVAGLFGTAD